MSVQVAEHGASEANGKKVCSEESKSVGDGSIKIGDTP